MSRHWQEQTGGDGLLPKMSIFVDVCGFTFRFSSISHLKETIEFYRRKTHPSSRLPGPEWVRQQTRADPKNYRMNINKFIRAEHTVMQRWWEKLPLYLQENGKRQRVIAALENAHKEFAQRPRRTRRAGP